MRSCRRQPRFRRDTSPTKGRRVKPATRCSKRNCSLTKSRSARKSRNEEEFAPVKTIHLLPVPDRRMFPAGKAAKYLGLSPDTLKKCTDEGQIVAYNFNGRRAYRLEDL